jgi:hypothetical protein
MTARLGTETMYGPLEPAWLHRAVLFSPKTERGRPRLTAGVAGIVSLQAATEPDRPAGCYTDSVYNPDRSGRVTVTLRHCSRTHSSGLRCIYGRPCKR